MFVQLFFNKRRYPFWHKDVFWGLRNSIIFLKKHFIIFELMRVILRIIVRFNQFHSKENTRWWLGDSFLAGNKKNRSMDEIIGCHIIDKWKERFWIICLFQSVSFFFEWNTLLDSIFHTFTKHLKQILALRPIFEEEGFRGVTDFTNFQPFWCFTADPFLPTPTDLVGYCPPVAWVR